jgi:Secretin and TonB N terminus short domain
MKRLIWAAWLSVAGATGAFAKDPASLMTQGKLDVDMGHEVAAGRAFDAVANDPGAPPSLRAEALVRLGLVRRAVRDDRGATEAFARVWKDYRQDKEAVAELIQALGGALPGPERWEKIWQKVAVVFDSGQASTRIDWPDVPVGMRRRPTPPLPSRRRGLVVARKGAGAGATGFKEEDQGPPAGSRRNAGQAITLDFKDGDLQDVFRLFADITGLNVVVHPGVQGAITFKCKETPWDEALDRILAPNGLAYTLVGPVLEIAPPRELPTPRAFDGKPINFDFKRVDLREALREVAAKGGRGLTPLPGLAGSVTLKLVGVPWDQAFDLVARLNGLVWKDDGRAIRVGLPAEMR